MGVAIMACTGQVPAARRRAATWLSVRLGPVSWMWRARASGTWRPRGGGGDGVGAATVALVRSKLEAVLSPVTRLDVVDVSGDGRHVTIDAVADVFEGKSKLQRQRLVFGALWEEMKDGGPLHAVDHMQTKTPSEAGL